jgi:hypothetical protein
MRQCGAAFRITAAALALNLSTVHNLETAMDIATFETELKTLGYDDIVVKQGEASTVNQPHQHEFAVRGMVTAGEFTLTKEGTPTTYRLGEIFSMEPNCSHTEGHGPAGSKYILGRKHL